MKKNPNGDQESLGLLLSFPLRIAVAGPALPSEVPAPGRGLSSSFSRGCRVLFLSWGLFSVQKTPVTSFVSSSPPSHALRSVPPLPSSSNTSGVSYTKIMSSVKRIQLLKIIFFYSSSVNCWEMGEWTLHHESAGHWGTGRRTSHLRNGIGDSKQREGLGRGCLLLSFTLASDPLFRIQTQRGEQNYSFPTLQTLKAA